MTCPPVALASIPRRLDDPRLAARAEGLVAALSREGFDDEAPAALFAVPGRIELIGKHVDYAGGRSLTCATEQGLLQVVCPTAQRRMRLLDVGRGEQARLEFASASKGGVARGGQSSWSRYAVAVVERLADDLPDLLSVAGVTVAFDSDLPSAAGMSSSSAMVVAAWQALTFAADRSGVALPHAFRSAEHVAGYLAAIESGRRVGTRGGAQDHAAILLAKPGHALQARYAPELVERWIGLPADHQIVVARSGVRAEKATGAREAFNRLADQASRLADLCLPPDATGPVLRPYLDGTIDRTTLMKAARSDSVLAARLRALLDEVDDVARAGDALARADLERFGDLAAASQERAERVLANQTAETAYLVDRARRLGATAASSMGAGFGGAVWAWVDHERASSFAERWLPDDRRVQREAGVDRVEASTLVTTAGSPARRIA